MRRLKEVIDMTDYLYETTKTNDVRILTDVIAEKKQTIQVIFEELSRITRDIHVPDIPLDHLDR